MARPRKHPIDQNLGDQKERIVTENFLKQNPEGFPDEAPKAEKIVLAKYVPEYKKVVFINGRDPGYPLDFHYSSKTHPLKHYHLFHGKECDLPVEIIDWLESRCEPQYGYRKGESGFQEHYIQSYKYIFQCRNPKNHRERVAA